MRVIIAFLALVVPATASEYMQAGTSIALSETLCGYEIPKTVKARFLGYISNELGIDDAAASRRVQIEATRIAQDVRERGAVKQYCDDLKLFAALANDLR